MKFMAAVLMSVLFAGNAFASGPVTCALDRQSKSDNPVAFVDRLEDGRLDVRLGKTSDRLNVDNEQYICDREFQIYSCTLVANPWNPNHTEEALLEQPYIEAQFTGASLRIQFGDSESIMYRNCK